MQFNIHKRVLDMPEDDITRGFGSAWSWTLDMANGATICRSPQEFMTEKLCRSHIAAAKKSMTGAMWCKVVTVDG